MENMLIIRFIDNMLNTLPNDILLVELFLLLKNKVSKFLFDKAILYFIQVTYDVILTNYSAKIT